MAREQSCAEIMLVDFDESVESLAQQYAFVGYDPIATYQAMLSKEPNKTVLATDVSHILMYVAIRGTKTSKTTKRMSDEGKANIQRLIGKYTIQENAAQAAASVISFSRIACAFPHIMLKICKKGIGRDVSPGGTLPQALRFMQAPSLFYDDQFKDAWLDWAKKVDAVINPGKADPNKVEQFYNVMRNGNFLSADQRKSILVRNSVVS